MEDNKNRTVIDGIDYNMIDIELIPEPYKTYIQIMGCEAFHAMIVKYGGDKIYIPKNGFLENLIRNDNIKHEYNGSNISHLIKKYDLSRSQIYQIIKKT